MEFKRTVGYKSHNYKLRARCDTCDTCKRCPGSGGSGGRVDLSKLEEEIELLKNKNKYLENEINKIKKIIGNNCIPDLCGRVELIYEVLNPSLVTGITINHP